MAAHKKQVLRWDLEGSWDTRVIYLRDEGFVRCVDRDGEIHVPIEVETR